jgi:hypothetical protein
MLRSAAITIIQRGLGFRSDLTDEIVSALQEAQRVFELGRTLPWFLKEEDQTFTAPSGIADIALPTGFLREIDGETFHYTDSTTGDRNYLEKFLDLNRMKQSLDTSETDPGKPLAYYLRKATVAVYPERDASYDLTWSYYKSADALTSDIENAWLAYAPEAMIGFAGKLVCEDIGLSDQAMVARHKRFEERHLRGWAGLFAEDILREQPNYQLNMGSRL